MIGRYFKILICIMYQIKPLRQYIQTYNYYMPIHSTHYCIQTTSSSLYNIRPTLPSGSQSVIIKFVFKFCTSKVNVNSFSFSHVVSFKMQLCVGCIRQLFQSSFLPTTQKKPFHLKISGFQINSNRPVISTLFAVRN